MIVFKSIVPFLFCWLGCSCTVGGIGDAGNINSIEGSSASPISSISTAKIFRSSIDRFVDKLYDETDTDGDGMISFDEAYVRCLLLYIRLNQSAPIPPPSREKFRRIIYEATGNKSKKLIALRKEEFGNVLNKVVGRAILRLISRKVVTVIGAPLLAEAIVMTLAARKDGFEALMRSIVPTRFHGDTIPILTSKAFHRGLWMVILVMTLGDVCLAVVTFLLDLSLPKAGSIHSDIDEHVSYLTDFHDEAI
mmetsp:Transcript_27223/g.60143  ORF Transcript_27223/g.60143 Transcript_27223/m.60143 type:complete len:250 (-) Transcript_27223:1503-2252(-)